MRSRNFHAFVDWVILISYSCALGGLISLLFGCAPVPAECFHLPECSDDAPVVEDGYVMVWRSWDSSTVRGNDGFSMSICEGWTYHTAVFPSMDLAIAKLQGPARSEHFIIIGYPVAPENLLGVWKIGEKQKVSAEIIEHKNEKEIVIEKWTETKWGME